MHRDMVSAHESAAAASHMVSAVAPNAVHTSGKDDTHDRRATGAPGSRRRTRRVSSHATAVPRGSLSDESWSARRCAPPADLLAREERSAAIELVWDLAFLPDGVRPAVIWERMVDAVVTLTGAIAVAVAEEQEDGGAVVIERGGGAPDAIPSRLDPALVDALLAGSVDVAALWANGATHRRVRIARAICVPLVDGTRDGVVVVLGFKAAIVPRADDLELLAGMVAATRSAVARELAFDRVRSHGSMLEAAQHQAGVGSWDWDLVTDRLTWSDELYRLHGLEPRSIPIDPETTGQWAHEEDRERVASALKNAQIEQAPFSFDYRIVLDDGTVRPVAAHGSVVTDTEARPIRLIGTVQDITERKRVEDELARQALLDPLTGLANRTLFSDRVEHAVLDRSIRLRSLAVMFLDLDRFKEINDTLGHAAGDIVLAEVARRLSTAVRPSDTVARVGGDEFAICLEGISGTPAAINAAERVLRALDRPILVRDRLVQTTASVGIALNSMSSPTARELIGSADMAMYRAKREGGRRWVVANRRHSWDTRP